MPVLFSIKEAAAIADVSERTLRKAIETNTVRPKVVSTGPARYYKFGVTDLLYLKLIATFPFPVGRNDKEAWRELIETKRAFSARWRRDDDAALCR